MQCSPWRRLAYRLTGSSRWVKNAGVALNCRCVRNMPVYRIIAVSINFLINYGPVRWKGVVLAFLVYIRVAIKVVRVILDTLLPSGGGTRTFRGLLIPSQGCSWKRLKWPGENIKPWIENRATSRHSTVNLGLVLLHKLFCIYMTKIRAFWVPDFAKSLKDWAAFSFHFTSLKHMIRKTSL